MTQEEVEAFIATLENVGSSEAYGYRFFFIGDDDRMPFATIAMMDNEYDSVSSLDREGVYRLNIGLSRESYDRVIGDTTTEGIDYSVLNVLMPHPDYAKQRFVCILNPSGENEALAKELLTEAHSIALARAQRRMGE